MGNLVRGGEVSDREYVKSLVKGADIYRKQGLYEEAREKYIEALSYVSNQKDLSNKPILIEFLEKRIHLVDEDLAAIDAADDTPELTPEMQDLIKEHFSFSNTRETAAFEGAVALLKFGQYKRALEEFETLLAAGIQPLTSARNIISCHLFLGHSEIAVDRYLQWQARTILTNQELSYIWDFLQRSLLERGIEAELPCPSTTPTGVIRKNPDKEADPEIFSVTLEFQEGELKGETEEFNVAFQFGNVVSIIVPSIRKDLIKILQPGARFLRMGFYSPIAFFKGAGKVISKAIIKQGPKMGDYLVDISYD